MTAEQEVIMLRQELVAVRKALRGSEAECDSLRQLIAKEVRTRRAHRTHRTHSVLLRLVTLVRTWSLG